VPRFTQAALLRLKLGNNGFGLFNRRLRFSEGRPDARQIERIDDRLRLGGHFDSFVFSSTSVDRRLRRELRPDALDNFEDFRHRTRALFRTVSGSFQNALDQRPRGRVDRINLAGPRFEACLFVALGHLSPLAANA
jgi:hypothetical protein